METERTRLRPLQPKDAERLAEYRSDAAVARYQSWERMSIEDADAFIASLPVEMLANDDEWSQLAIADRTSDEIIGDIGLCRKIDGGVEIGFTLSPAAQGRGLAAEACRAVIEWVFSNSAITTLEAIVDSRNDAAIALVKRLGMTIDRSAIAEFKGERCTELRFVMRRETSPESRRP